MLISLINFILLVQDTAVQVDTTGISYKVGLYIGSILPFIILLIIFLLIIRGSYRFKNK